MGNQRLGARLRNFAGKAVVKRDIKENRPVITRQFFNMMCARKQEVHILSLLHQAAQVLKDFRLELAVMNLVLQNLKLIKQQDQFAVVKLRLDLIQKTIEREDRIGFRPVLLNKIDAL